MKIQAQVFSTCAFFLFCYFDFLKRAVSCVITAGRDDRYVKKAKNPNRQYRGFSTQNQKHSRQAVFSALIKHFFKHANFSDDFYHENVLGQHRVERRVKCRVYASPYASLGKVFLVVFDGFQC